MPDQLTVKSYISDLAAQVEAAAVDSRIFVVYYRSVNNDNPNTRRFFRSISITTNRLIALEARINAVDYSGRYNIAGIFRSRHPYTDYAVSNSQRFHQLIYTMLKKMTKEDIF